MAHFKNNPALTFLIEHMVESVKYICQNIFANYTYINMQGLHVYHMKLLMIGTTSHTEWFRFQNSTKSHNASRYQPYYLHIQAETLKR